MAANLIRFVCNKPALWIGALNWTGLNRIGVWLCGLVKSAQNLHRSGRHMIKIGLTGVVVTMHYFFGLDGGLQCTYLVLHRLLVRIPFYSSLPRSAPTSRLLALYGNHWNLLNHNHETEVPVRYIVNIVKRLYLKSLIQSGTQCGQLLLQISAVASMSGVKSWRNSRSSKKKHTIHSYSTPT